jgi:hypothetical protein
MKKLKLTTPLPYVLLLPSLLIPRVVVHDLHLVSFDTAMYKLLALLPLAIWLVYAVVRRREHPMREFLVYGAVYGLLLALTHQLLWVTSFGGNPPHIGGNLSGKLDPVAEDMILRSFAFVSSVVTGLVTGALFGMVGMVAGRVRPGRD